MEAGNDKFEIPENSEIEGCIIKLFFPTALPLLDQQEESPCHPRISIGKRDDARQYFIIRPSELETPLPISVLLDFERLRDIVSTGVEIDRELSIQKCLLVCE